MDAITKTLYVWNTFQKCLSMENQTSIPVMFIQKKYEFNEYLTYFKNC